MTFSKRCEGFVGFENGESANDVCIVMNLVRRFKISKLF